MRPTRTTVLTAILAVVTMTAGLMGPARAASPAATTLLPSTVPFRGGVVPVTTEVTTRAARGTPAVQPACVSISTMRCPEWVSGFASSIGDDLLTSAVTTRSGDRVFVTGFAADGTAAETIAYDAATGTELWSRVDLELARGQALTLSPDERTLYVTGRACIPNACDYTTAAYDAATGARRWMTFGSNVSRAPYAAACCIQVSPDGSRVFVTGWNQYQDAETLPTICNWCVAHYVTVAYDTADGTIVWSKAYRGPLRSDQQNFSQARALALSPDGATVYVTGDASAAATDTPPRITYGITIAYDAATGGQRWLHRYSGDLVSSTRGVAVSADGLRVYTGGFDRHFETSPCQNRFCVVDSFFTTGISAVNGAQLWRSRIPGLGDAITLRLASGTDRVIVAGYSPDHRGYRFGVAVQATDGSTGAPAWLWHDAVQTDDGVVTNLAVSRDEDTVFVVGPFTPTASAGAGSGFAMRAVGFDVATGAQTWEARRPSGYSAMPFGIATLPDDRLVLTGTSFQPDPAAPEGIQQSGVTVMWTATPYDPTGLP